MTRIEISRKFSKTLVVRPEVSFGIKVSFIVKQEIKLAKTILLVRLMKKVSYCIHFEFLLTTTTRGQHNHLYKITKPTPNFLSILRWISTDKIARECCMTNTHQQNMNISNLFFSIQKKKNHVCAEKYT